MKMFLYKKFKLETKKYKFSQENQDAPCNWENQKSGKLEIDNIKTNLSKNQETKENKKIQKT
jgi:hypothetical protein